MGEPPNTRIARFWAKVDRSGGPQACWPWLGKKQTKSGYGLVCFCRRETTAHRIAYELQTGDLLGERYGLHSCDNPPCCNPAHIVPGTQADNIADMIAKGRKVVVSLSGEAHGRCVISDADVLQLRRLYAAGGVSQCSLAGQFDISQAQVSRIVRMENRA